jgi:hypothetical protein
MEVKVVDTTVDNPKSPELSADAMNAITEISSIALKRKVTARDVERVLKLDELFQAIGHFVVEFSTLEIAN